MDNYPKYKMGQWIKEWHEHEAHNLTFIVTEDCNLRCKYCYVTHKADNARMKFDTAKKFIDYIFDIKTPDQHAVVLDFIGGEPMLEVELIDQICDYFKYKAFLLNDEWYWNYRISICTNGINYDSKEVQNFIYKNYLKLSVTITIDGTKKKHDMQRVFPNGEGSYNTVVKNIPMWLEQFGGSTKVTFSSDDLPFLKESIIHLWNLGIIEVAANVVFEDVWVEGDDIIFEEQLKSLADYVIENDLYDKYQCTLFLDNIGGGETEETLSESSCGAGIMLALGVDGKIYPCQRYYPHSLNNKEGYVLGDVDNGIDMNRMRVFGILSKKYQCDEECKNCDVAGGCMFCQAFCYDEADTKTNFQRVKYICKMHKARVRANNYYFAKLKNVKGISSERPVYSKRLFFILRDDYVAFCPYENIAAPDTRFMNKMDILKGLEYSYYHFMKPIFLHAREENYEYFDEYSHYEILHIIPLEFLMNNKFEHGEEYLLVFDTDSVKNIQKYHTRITNERITNVMLNIKCEEVGLLSQFAVKLFEFADRINLNIIGLNQNFDLDTYERELKKCANTIIDSAKGTGIKEMNVLTDILWLEKHDGCAAGEKAIAYAPDGNMYICPAYYSERMGHVGTLEEHHIANRHLYSINNFPICQRCDTYQCERCVYLNVKNTLEVNVSPDFQCKKAHIERKISMYLAKNIAGEIKMNHSLDSIEYDDPYYLFSKSNELFKTKV